MTAKLYLLALVVAVWWHGSPPVAGSELLVLLWCQREGSQMSVIGGQNETNCSLLAAYMPLHWMQTSQCIQHRKEVMMDWLNLWSISQNEVSSIKMASSVQVSLSSLFPPHLFLLTFPSSFVPPRLSLLTCASSLVPLFSYHAPPIPDIILIFVPCLNKRVRDPVTCRVFQIKYSKIFQVEYFNNESVTKSCNICFDLTFLFLSWLPSQEYLIAYQNSLHPIHCFQQLDLYLRLIVGQANLQLRPAIFTYSLATTTNKLALVHRYQFMSQAF